MSDHNKSKGASPEQLLYADILEKSMYIGLGLMLLTFLVYLTGIMKPAVPLDQISNYWKMPVSAKDGHGAAQPAKEEPPPKPGYLQSINKDFLHLEKPPTGWAWLNLLGYSDFLNFLPVAMLAGVTILCYAAIIPGLFRRKDKAYAIMAIAEVAILVLAASNLLTVGGH